MTKFIILHLVNSLLGHSMKAIVAKLTMRLNAVKIKQDLKCYKLIHIKKSTPMKNNNV